VPNADRTVWKDKRDYVKKKIALLFGLVYRRNHSPGAPLSFRRREEMRDQLPKGINEITVAVRLTYRPRPGNIYSLHTFSRKVKIDTR